MIGNAIRYSEPNYSVEEVMVEYDMLEYLPQGYQRGDPCDFGYAVIHDFVVLVATWLLERICELNLLSDVKRILFSNATVRIMLNNSNWLGVAR